MWGSYMQKRVFFVYFASLNAQGVGDEKIVGI